MGLKRSKPHGRVQDSLGRLWRFFEKVDGAWKTANAGFEKRTAVTVDGTPGLIIFKIHAVRSESARAGKVDFKSSITVWPVMKTGRRGPARVREGSTTWRLTKDWCQKYQREVGRFGDFWKPLEDAGAVAREVKLLDRLRL